MDASMVMDALPRPQCTAKSKQSGERCKRRPHPGATVCVIHGAGSPQVQANARERLMALQPLAIQTIHSLLQREEFPTVQLGAAREVFDRTEGKPAQAVALTGGDGKPLEIIISKPW
jgi:hypothetical protein